MCKLVITEPGLRLRRMRNGCVRNDQEVRSDRLCVCVCAIIITHITGIIHIIISFSVYLQ